MIRERDCDENMILGNHKNGPVLSLPSRSRWNGVFFANSGVLSPKKPEAIQTTFEFTVHNGKVRKPRTTKEHGQLIDETQEKKQVGDY